MHQPVTILGIESSCDDTAAAIIQDGKILANLVAGQTVHEQYGGVVPELASRAHQQNIVPVVDQALKTAGINRQDINAVAFTNGPGLLGSLLVGTSFAKGLSMALNIPMIEVHHMQAHILAHFIKDKEGKGNIPPFPFICLTVSGGHTQIVLVEDHFKMKVLGQTLDDAAGEAFDKVAKILGLPYPGGPVVDKLAALGDPKAFAFPQANLDNFNFSFSGLKTAFLYFVRDEIKKDPDFVTKRMNDLCASVQHTIVASLMKKLREAVRHTGCKDVAVAGGVAANRGLRKALEDASQKEGWKIFLPEFEFTTDNAAMVAMAGYFKYLNKEFAPRDLVPQARVHIPHG